MASTLAENWDAHWSQKLAIPVWRQMVQAGLGSSLLIDRLQLLRKRNVHRLLLTGNGCSLLPHALVHVGFHTTVVDISAVANDVVRTAQPTPELLSFFLREYRKSEEGNGLVQDKEASLQRVAREAKPGGCLEVVTADIREWQPEMPFDALYDDRLMQLLPWSDWPLMAQRYREWLTPHGLCILHTINLGGNIYQDVSAVRTPFEAAFTDAGFHDLHPSSDQSSKVTAEPSGRDVLFLHGSG